MYYPCVPRDCFIMPGLVQMASEHKMQLEKQLKVETDAEEIQATS